MNYNEKKTKFTEYVKKFHESPKTVDDYVSFVGKCAWALSQGSSLTWADVEQAMKDAGINPTVS